MEQKEILELAMLGVFRMMENEPSRKAELEEKVKIIARMIVLLQYENEN